MSSEKKWLQIWAELSQRILKLPSWMQRILLDDLEVAIRNRITVMERIQKKKVSE